jgi:flagellar biosynthesis/type III secretory pathway chaperone
MQHTETKESLQAFEENLRRLKVVLDEEHRALLQGDAKQVATLACDKEEIAAALDEARTSLPESSSLSDEIAALAKAVEELAGLNHMLLKQLYQHYHGMVELFMRLAGQTRTYGKDGALSIGPNTMKDAEILA